MHRIRGDSTIHLSYDRSIERAEDLNESIQLESSHVVKILREQQPETCELVKTENNLRVNLTFSVKLRNKARTVRFFFKAERDDGANDAQMFLVALMKLTIENGIVIHKMRKALEAKNKEIEEYKRSGATLIRGNCLL
jgi:hypothetical protein